MRFFDAHFHIIDSDFPLVSNQGFLPTSFQCADYKNFQNSLLQEHRCELIGGAVVSGSFQGYDQSYLCDALRELGGQYVGVVQMDPYDQVSNADLYTLHSQGIRAVRFNFQRGICSRALSSSDYQDPVAAIAAENHHLSTVQVFIHRIYELLGWHAEFYIRSSSLLHSSSTLFKLLASAPKVVIHRPPWNGRGRIGEQRDRVTVRVWVVVAGLSVHREAGRVHVK